MSEISRENIGNDVIAVMSSRGDADAAVSELRDLGFEAEGIRIYRPGEAEATLDPFGHRSGLLTRIFKHFQGHLSDENKLLEEYEQAAQAGNDIIAVRVDKPGQPEAASEILERHNAANIRHFGSLAVRDMQAQGRATPLE